MIKCLLGQPSTERNSVENRPSALPVPYGVHIEPEHVAVVPNQRTTWWQPQFERTNPGVWRIVVDLLLGSRAQGLNHGSISRAGERIHALLHRRIGVGRPVAPNRP